MTGRRFTLEDLEAVQRQTRGAAELNDVGHSFGSVAPSQDGTSDAGRFIPEHDPDPNDPLDMGAELQDK
jgi:hypothetical protein